VRLRVVAAMALGIALAIAAPASEPGQPLDCSDWVFLEPGLTCTPIDSNCGNGSPGSDWCTGGRSTEVLATGWPVRMFHRAISPPISCGLNAVNALVELVRFDGSTSRRIATLQERCVADGRVDKVSAGELNWFDPADGSLYFHLQLWCDSDTTTGPCEYGSRTLLGKISGFVTTFEILQTYAPTSGPLSFSVPYMPEGFQYADFFDTYWGEARPLQCGYPSTQPSVGDHLAVEDTLPTPAPGTGRYYVTAVTHLGQRRFGRKAGGGVLTGRDPSALPGCE